MRTILLALVLCGAGAAQSSVHRISGMRNSVELDDQLRVTVHAGPAVWNLMPSADDDLLVAKNGDEFHLRLASARDIQSPQAQRPPELLSSLIRSERRGSVPALLDFTPGAITIGVQILLVLASCEGRHHDCSARFPVSGYHAPWLSCRHGGRLGRWRLADLARTQGA